MKSPFVALVLLAAHATDGRAEDSHLTIELHSGRTYTAPVDVRSDDTKLWLRFEGRSVQLLRSVAWSDISSASYQGKSLELSTLPTFAQSIEHNASIVAGMTSHVPAGQTHEQAAGQLLFVQPVESLQVSAQMETRKANGIQLKLELRDRTGNLTSAKVRVAATLETASRSEESADAGFRHVRQWIKTAAIDGDHNTLSLPLPAKVAGELGRVKVRVLVPGQGEFERQAYVRLGR